MQSAFMKCFLENGRGNPLFLCHCEECNDEAIQILEVLYEDLQLKNKIT
jgi:hypothetical protein